MPRASMALMVGVIAAIVLVGCGDDDDDRASESDEGAGVDFGSPWSLSGRLSIAGDVDLAERDGIVVAVGFGPDDRLVTFSSSDGKEWEPGLGIPDVRQFGPGIAVAAGPTGFVAVATDDQRDDRAVVVFSGDGSTWEEIDAVNLPDGEVNRLTNVIAGSGGFVIVGHSGFPDGPGGATVWFSSDGSMWTRTDFPSIDIDIAMGTSGSDWLAIGADSPAELARVFTSRDGINWREVDAATAPPVDAVAAYGGPASLAFIGESWAFASVAETGPPSIWSSTDKGEVWVETVVETSASPLPYVIGDMAVTNHGLLVVGSQDVAPGSGDAEDPFLLVSEDGATADRFTAITRLHAIAPLGDDVVALDGDGNVFLWSDGGD